MSIPFRTYLRIALIIALAVLVLRRYSTVSPTRLVLILAGLLVLAAVVFQMTSALRKSRKLREEVPKHPLGLDS